MQEAGYHPVVARQTRLYLLALRPLQFGVWLVPAHRPARPAPCLRQLTFLTQLQAMRRLSMWTFST